MKRAPVPSMYRRPCRVGRVRWRLCQTSLGGPPPMLANMHTILQNHVALTVSCIDRLYLNGYVPKLQTSGQLCYFLRDHLGYPLPSPALFRPLHDRFVGAVQALAAQHALPVVAFARGQRKDDIAAGYRARFTAEGGAVFIGVAQEKAGSFKAQKGQRPGGGVPFRFSPPPVSVHHSYFY